jgi:sigma-B regulation protein RsbU (phosphoserine phosphatase)
MEGKRVLRVRFPSDPQGLKTVRSQVREIAASCGCAEKTAAELVIAVNEACMNIMQHAYKGDCSGEIVLEITNNGDELEFQLTDFAEPVDCSRIAPRDLDELRPGGLGTHFIREIMDEFVYGHLEGECGNYLRMKKKIG